MARIEIDGKTIGWLTVIEREETVGNSHRAMYKCRCQCGNVCSLEKGRLLKGDFPACSECMSNPDNYSIMDQLRKDIVLAVEQEERKLKEKKSIYTVKENEDGIDIILSGEQRRFVDVALAGNNILVDACIGSGKTTAIQMLCKMFPKEKRVLYLTYNRLLKADAKKKIHQNNVVVTNYHGYAFMVLKKLGIKVGIPDLIQEFIKIQPQIEKYDVLLIDEYQDIEQELADMLVLIKSSNPNMQIIAVGDMEQKIYDKTTLDIRSFISSYLGQYIDLQFTQCFRLSADLAAKLGRIWEKTIIGVNQQCVVDEMDVEDIIHFLSTKETGDILCLGSRRGDMSKVLNRLESLYPDKFNKSTVYASIADTDTTRVEPKDNSAIFTTYDSSKGLERPICVIFDFTEEYWNFRIDSPLQDYSILRNIFCVAASRGKQRIIFVKGKDELLSEETLSTAVWRNEKMIRECVSKMFDFKYKENIETCYNLLRINQLNADDTHIIRIKENDGLIDLSPCIGIYQESSYFNAYDIDNDIKLFLKFYNKLEHLYDSSIKEASVEEKILFLTSLETGQLRYMTQVELPFISEDQSKQIHKRLAERLKKDEIVQANCFMPFYDKLGKTFFEVGGNVDVIKDDVVYELKFVYALQHEHFLQCAVYMLALNKPIGRLWNIRDNTIFEISIPDRSRLIEEIAITVTKGTINKPQRTISRNPEEKIAVIDTETNWNDQVMSIGVVISNSEDYLPERGRYYVLSPEANFGGMYQSVLLEDKIEETIKCSRKQAIDDLITFLEENSVKKVFAYNASFDMNHLPELASFEWHDIMRIAANKYTNWAIPKNAECYKNGKLKRDYGVEPIMRLLTGEATYKEIHNAIMDATDELSIMRHLKKHIDEYEPISSSRKIKKYEEEETTHSNSYDKMKYEEDNSLIHITYTVAEVAKRLGVSKSYVYGLIRGGQLRAVKRKNRYEIDRKALNDYMEYLTKQRQKNFIISLLFLIFFAGLLFYLMFK